MPWTYLQRLEGDKEIEYIQTTKAAKSCIPLDVLQDAFQQYAAEVELLQAPVVGSQSLGIWDITAAPGLLDNWNCAHPVKIPFGWEGQLHECQQQFCVHLSWPVDHLTFVVGCFDNLCALSNQKGEKPELQQLAAGLPDVVLSGRADSTTKKYLGAFQRWKVWAESMEIVPSFPVKGMHLALYMQHLSTAKHSRSAVEEVVHALAWMHKMAGIESPMES
ncbi:hypothetical protein EMCRGX_G027959 [Ephydatia muelleri]